MADSADKNVCATAVSQFALEAIQLSKFHGEHPALRQVEFALRPGEVLAVLGHNGAGKTTLLHILALVARPTSGTVRIGGRDMVGAERLAARASIGLLAHQTFLYDELTARENLEFFARLYGLAGGRALAERQLEAAGLAEVGDELVRHFSRGMRQRLALARTFLHQPELALLDEPFTGLDESASKTLRELVASWRRAGRTVVLSSHDRAQALELATTILVLDRGRMAHFGESTPHSALRIPHSTEGRV